MQETDRRTSCKQTKCVRGCYQLRGLVVSGNPVSEEPKLRHYIIKALPCLEALDDKPLRTKVQCHKYCDRGSFILVLLQVEVPTVVSSSSVYILCKRQIAEQAANKPSVYAVCTRLLSTPRSGCQRQPSLGRAQTSSLYNQGPPVPGGPRRQTTENKGTVS